MIMMLQVLKMMVKINLKDWQYDDDVVGVEDDGLYDNDVVCVEDGGQDQPEGLLL